MRCEAAQASLEALFTEELEPRPYATLRAHLAHCPECREQYDKLARVEAALERAVVSPSRQSLLESVLLDRVVTQEAPASAGWLSRLSPALGALAFLLLVIPLSRAVKSDGGFTPRGHATGAYGVRAFCVAGGAPPRVTGEARPSGTLRCPLGSVVQLTYTAPRDVELSIHLSGTGLRIFPKGEERSLVKQGVDVPLAFSTPVEPSWLNGTVRMVARFAEPSTGKMIAETWVVLAPVD
ncbi:MAG: zf-HC2 domain-containing protein [Myxococcota bacterium]